SWSQLQELKTTVAIAYGSNLGVRRNAGERQFRARNQRSGLVFYGTGYASCWRGGNCWSKHQGERGKYNSQDAGHSGWIHGLPPYTPGMAVATPHGPPTARNLQAPRPPHVTNCLHIQPRHQSDFTQTHTTEI